MVKVRGDLVIWNRCFWLDIFGFFLFGMFLVKTVFCLGTYLRCLLFFLLWFFF